MSYPLEVMRIGLNTARSEGVMQDAAILLDGLTRFMNGVRATCTTSSLVVLFKYDVDSYERMWLWLEFACMPRSQC
jgi:hypothetical protein